MPFVSFSKERPPAVWLGAFFLEVEVGPDKRWDTARNDIVGIEEIQGEPFVGVAEYEKAKRVFLAAFMVSRVHARKRRRADTGKKWVLAVYLS